MSHLIALIALISSIRNDDEGQGLAEYALILALIAIVADHRPHLPGQPGQHDPEHGRHSPSSSATVATRRSDRRASRPGGPSFWRVRTTVRSGTLTASDWSPVPFGAPRLRRREISRKGGTNHMTQLIALISSIRNDDEGQGLAEYALILALIAIVAIIALIFLGSQVSRHPEHGRHVRLGPARPVGSEAAGRDGPAASPFLAGPWCVHAAVHTIGLLTPPTCAVCWPQRHPSPVRHARSRKGGEPHDRAVPDPPHHRLVSSTTRRSGSRRVRTHPRTHRDRRHHRPPLPGKPGQHEAERDRDTPSRHPSQTPTDRPQGPTALSIQARQRTTRRASRASGRPEPCSLPCSVQRFPAVSS